MIYVFEDGAVVYDGSTISEEEKQKVVAVVVLPEPEKIEGKIAVLRANKAENRVIYKGQTYESLIDDNVWNPEDYPEGWGLV